MQQHAHITTSSPNAYLQNTTGSLRTPAHHFSQTSFSGAFSQPALQQPQLHQLDQKRMQVFAALSKLLAAQGQLLPRPHPPSTSQDLVLNSQVSSQQEECKEGLSCPTKDLLFNSCTEEDLSAARMLLSASRAFELRMTSGSKLNEPFDVEKESNSMEEGNHKGQAITPVSCQLAVEKSTLRNIQEQQAKTPQEFTRCRRGGAQANDQEAKTPTLQKRSSSDQSTKCDSTKRGGPESPQDSESTNDPHFTRTEQTLSFQRILSYQQSLNNQPLQGGGTISKSLIQNGQFFLNGVLIIQKILDSDNLNECVDIILSKDRIITHTEASVLEEINAIQNIPPSASKAVRQHQHQNEGIAKTLPAEKYSSTKIFKGPIAYAGRPALGSDTTAITHSQKSSTLDIVVEISKPSNSLGEEQPTRSAKVLRVSGGGPSTQGSIASRSSLMAAERKRQRQRKNDAQHHILMNEFNKNPNWDKSIIQKLSDAVGLKISQIYKWNWDQQKKSRPSQASSLSMDSGDAQMTLIE